MKLFFFLICTFSHLLICTFTFAQNPKIDSLQNLLKTSKKDTVEVKILNALSTELYSFNLENALKSAQEALLLSKKIAFKKGIAAALSNIGYITFYQGKYDEALNYHQQALQISQELKDKKAIATSLNYIGIVYRDLGNYSKSIDYYFQSLRVQEEINNKKGIASALLNIGVVYSDQGNYELAIEYQQKALLIFKETGDAAQTANTLTRIGNIYWEKDEYKSALENYRQALLIFQNINHQRGIAVVLNNIAGVYGDEKNYDAALDYYLKALAIRSEIGDKNGIAIILNNIGTLYLDLNNFHKALSYFNQSLKQATAIGYKEIVKDNYLHISSTYSKMNDYKKAFEFHQLYSKMKDSLFNEESSKQITEMSTKYETEKKEQQITLLNKDREIQNAEVRRQKIVIWLVVSGLLLVVILARFIFKERRKSEKLLLNILPAETAKELKSKGKATAKHYQSVTVMFTDFKDFTTIAEKLSAEELVSELDFLFKKFDEIISKYNIEKIKTIGDAYMCASGLPIPNANHAEEIVKAGLEIQNWMIEQNGKWNLRIGVHSGPVTAGVVGDKKFAYDIWGDTVNTASRMESSGEAGKINISGATYAHLVETHNYASLQFKHRGKIPAKNKGEIEMYFAEKV